eukprot:4783115-Amphidinium_carterae.1
MRTRESPAAVSRHTNYSLVTYQSHIHAHSFIMFIMISRVTHMSTSCPVKFLPSGTATSSRQFCAVARPNTCHTLYACTPASHVRMAHTHTGSRHEACLPSPRENLLAKVSERKNS